MVRGAHCRQRSPTQMTDEETSTPLTVKPVSSYLRRAERRSPNVMAARLVASSLWALCAQELGSKSNPYAPITGVCPRCEAQLLWRRKYGKYKPLIQAAKCISCSRRNVRQAYHALCAECAKSRRACAKCCQAADVLVGSHLEKEKAERQQLEEALGGLRERERRTLLRTVSTLRTHVSPLEKGPANTRAQKTAARVAAKAQAASTGAKLDSDDSDFSDSDFDGTEGGSSGDEDEDPEVNGAQACRRGGDKDAARFVGRAEVLPLGSFPASATEHTQGKAAVAEAAGAAADAAGGAKAAYSNRDEDEDEARDSEEEWTEDDGEGGSEGEGEEELVAGLHRAKT
eukprot:SM000253S09040  [mRNA]  locus=s253:94824:97790:- [translate_table: standard]